MLKYISFIIFLLLSKCYAQPYTKYSVRDKVTDAVIPNARITHKNQLFYTNDDGDVLVPMQLDSFEVSAINYQTEVFAKTSPLIKLEPAYRSIPEISFIGIDVKRIFQNVLENYTKRYYAKPSLYRGTLKQKGYMNAELNNLIVADINLWSRYNFFNFKARDNFDAFVQIGLDQIKYAKSSKGKKDYPFNTDLQLIPNDFVQTIFMNSMLTTILENTTNKGVRGKMTDEGTDLRYISFDADENDVDGRQISGRFTYHIKDSVLTSLEVSINQKNNILYEKNKKGEPYTVKTTQFKVVFDFYKNIGQYVPAQIQVMGHGISDYNNKVIPFSFSQILNLTDFQPTTSKGLKRKINLNKNLVDNIPSKERNKMNELLLSKEEQQFIDE